MVHCLGYFLGTFFKITDLSSLNVIATDDLPAFALQDDRVVEIVGEPASVHAALELIASHLRKFLVDRSIIPLFEKQVIVYFGICLLVNLCYSVRMPLCITYWVLSFRCKHQVTPWSICHLSHGVPLMAFRPVQVAHMAMDLILGTCHLLPVNLTIIIHQLRWRPHLIGSLTKASLPMEENLQLVFMLHLMLRQHSL